MSHQITRRRLLKSAPAVGVIGLPSAAPLAASTEGPSEVETLYRRWRDAVDRVNAEVHGVGRDEELTAYLKAADALEVEIAEAAPLSLKDYAIKLCVWTRWGVDGMCPTTDPAMTAEMLALSRLQKPEGY